MGKDMIGTNSVHIESKGMLARQKKTEGIKRNNNQKHKNDKKWKKRRYKHPYIGKKNKHQKTMRHCS